MGDGCVAEGVVLGAMKNAMEGGVGVRTEGAVGREGRVAAVEELVGCGDPKEETIDASDGADRTVPDEFKNRGKDRAVGLGEEERCRGD